MSAKWITSMELLAPLVMPIIEIVRPHTIAEIGAAEGGNTKILYDYLKKTQGKLITMDPSPRGSFMEWVQQVSDVVVHLPEYSLQCISKAGRVDAWFIDGDHNWYTVFNELRLIDELARVNSIPALIFMHDVSWPCARRDMYYDPSQIPAEYLQPCSAELGLTLDKQATVKGALKGVHWALQEGGLKNGVLTAVEDFMQYTKTRYQWIHIPAILGLGVLVSEAHPLARFIVDYYLPYHNNPVIELLEKDRIKHYLATVELQRG